jgi:hypothetical protein
MAYYRFVVPGGEFVLRGECHWQITFNGVQIGGAHATAGDALTAVKRRREGSVVGPVLDGAPDPPQDLLMWSSATPRRSEPARERDAGSLVRDHDACASVYRPVGREHRSGIASAIGRGAYRQASWGLELRSRRNVIT